MVVAKALFLFYISIALDENKFSFLNRLGIASAYILLLPIYSMSKKPLTE